jgi:hypothetical protein
MKLVLTYFEQISGMSINTGPVGSSSAKREKGSAQEPRRRVQPEGTQAFVPARMYPLNGLSPSKISLSETTPPQRATEQFPSFPVGAPMPTLSFGWSNHLARCVK